MGVRLYQQGYVDKLIMSGDGHDSSGYGEPTVMRAIAEDMGVPADAIVEDPLGSRHVLLVRARTGSGSAPGSVIVATQEFHSARAVWLCDRAGLETQGAYPPIAPAQGHGRGQPPGAHRRREGVDGRAERSRAAGLASPLPAN